MATPAPQQVPIQKKPPVYTTVDQLKPGTHGHNIKLKVVNTSTVIEKTRSDGTKTRIAECMVGDNTASITLTARNEQIDKVSPGRTIIVRNAKIDMFKGFMRLAVDKWGKIEVATEPATFEINANNNLSNVEYELVTVNDNE